VVYSPGSRANRAAVGAGGRGCGAGELSTPRSSIEAIFVTDTTSTSKALPQADWEDLEQGYTAWLYAVLAGSLTRFYDTLRWPGWQDEVDALLPDEGLTVFPPPWSQEGQDLSPRPHARAAGPACVLLPGHGTPVGIPGSVVTAGDRRNRTASGTSIG